VLVFGWINRCHWSLIFVHQHLTCTSVWPNCELYFYSLLLILAKQHCDRIAHTWSTTPATKLLLVLIDVSEGPARKVRRRLRGLFLGDRVRSSLIPGS
jgi:hypothetical protein